MPQDIQGQIETLVGRIDSSDAIDAADADVLHAFHDRLTLLDSEYSDYRHKKLLRHTVIMAEQCGGLAAALDDQDAAEEIVGWINSSYDNEETQRDYRSALRVFGKRVTEYTEAGDSAVPPSLQWVPAGTSSNYDPSPDPRDMLEWDADIQPMLDACRNSRDRAMIALQFDAGLRGGEFKALSVGDLSQHDHGLQVTVDGKEGRRTVLLIPSVSYVSSWLDDHPGGPDAALWSKLNDADRISDTMLYKAFKAAAARAGVEKPVTLTNFRKSSAAFLARRNLNQVHIEDHHGWVRGSRVAARYISVFGQDTDREVARVHGVDVSDEEPEDIQRVCPRCEQSTPRSETACVWCGQVLDREAAAELESVQSDLARTLAQLDEDQAMELVDVTESISDPEVKNILLEALLTGHR
jgi:hypothetical protein